MWRKYLANISAGRNSSGRITSFHRGGGSKRLHRKIDLKRSSSSMGIVEKIEYDPNRSTRIAQVRWKGVRVGNKSCPFLLQRETANSTSQKLAEMSGPITPFAFSSWSKGHRVNGTDALSSAFSSGGGSLGFPRVAVAGAKPGFYAFRMRDKEVKGKNAFSLGEIRKLWADRVSRREEAVSWQGIKAGLGGRNGPGPGPKGDLSRWGVDRVPVSYVIASHQMEAGNMVMNCDWSKTSTANPY